MTIHYKAILGAFEPAKEITDPKKFAGRREQVEKGCELLTSKDHIFIYGIRGIGKSSLAHQLNLIASGDNRLLEDINSSFRTDKLDYVTCFITCDDSVTNINTLMYRLLRDEEGLAQWNTILGFSEIGSFELEGALNTALISEFNNRVGRLADGTKDGLIVFIDEFDRIKNQDGFSSLIKSAPKNCIYVVTGIASTEKSLIRDHESIVRKLDMGKLLVPSMSEAELRLIVERAEREVNGEILFDKAVIVQLVKIAQGQPYLLQLIGKFCLTTAHKANSATITSEILAKALKEIALNRASFLEDQYLRAIGNSPNREIVLRVFAASNADPVNTAEAYPAAKESGVSNPSYYVGDLTKEQFGSRLVKVAEQFYRIPDPLFKAYVTAIPSRLESGSVIEESALAQNPTQASPNKRNIIHILHLSDIHFGPTHYFTQLPMAHDKIPAPDKPKFQRYLTDELLSNLSSFAPNLIIMSGDFTQSALSNEFEEAGNAINEIRQSVSLAKERIVICPGNHDVNWGVQIADPTNKLLPFTAYLNFCKSICAKEYSALAPEDIFTIHDFIDELQCVVLTLNSAILESKEDHRGYIGESQLKKALESIENLLRGRKAVKIAVFHHHIVSVSSIEENYGKPDELLRDVGYVKQALLSAGFSLLLHGHRHHGHEEQIGNGTSNLVVIGCGSSGVVASERHSQQLQFNKISVTIVRDGEDRQLLISIHRHYFDVERRKWVRSEDRKPQFKISY